MAEPIISSLQQLMLLRYELQKLSTVAVIEFPVISDRALYDWSTSKLDKHQIKFIKSQTIKL